MKQTGTKTDIFSTDAGDVNLSRPAILSESDALGAMLWLEMMKEKIKRSIDPTTTQNVRPIKAPKVIRDNGDDEPEPQIAAGRLRTGP